MLLEIGRKVHAAELSGRLESTAWPDAGKLPGLLSEPKEICDFHKVGIFPYMNCRKRRIAPYATIA